MIVIVNMFFAEMVLLHLMVMTLTVEDNIRLAGYLCIVMYIVKSSWLPLTYGILEKKSKNKIILCFIKLLKTNILFKIFILFLIFIYDYKLYFASSKTKFNLFSQIHIYTYIYAGLFGSYLFLFFFWEIEKFWRREKEKGNKYVCAVYEWCVKFQSNVKALLDRKVL
ncbi:MAG: hypothetical protein BHV87_12655 [Clostridiales bacterium 36_14]|nr:MAG: hypothetical protein BHV87_12655 [Clostridiales bacterium 36_14]